MQKFRFQYQLEAKVLENNFGPSVKLSDKKIQNGRQNPRWLPIFTFLSHYASTFLLLNTKSWFWSLFIRLHVWVIGY